jgi:hypothetical protein
MLCGEPNVPLAILQASGQLLNLHLSDTNRAPVGRGMIDVDTVIRALYLIGFNTPGHFATGEPIGEGRESYSITYGRYSESLKEKLVSDTVDYFREREREIVGN